MIYLAAFISKPGQSLLDVEPSDVAQRYLDSAKRSGGGWRLPASPAFLDQWGTHDPALRDRVAPRLTDFPLRCLTDPADFDERALDAIRKVYVRHTAPPLPSLDMSLGIAVAAGWEIHEVACGHDLMLAAPDETAALLDVISRGPG